MQVSSHYLPTHTGGAERCVQALARAQRQAGHEVEIVAPVPAHRDDGIPVRSMPATAPRLLQKLIFDYASPGANEALRHAMTQFRPDVVHVHNVYGIGSELLRVASRFAPTVVTLHDYWPIDVVAPAYRGGRIRHPLRAQIAAPWTLAHRAWHRRNLRYATVVAPSKFLASRVSRALGVRIDVVSNAVSTPDAASRREPIVMFAGRLVREKGIDLVLTQVIAAATKHGWRVEVAGDGPLGPELRSRFPSVLWHGATDPAPIYERASVLLVPSMWPENAPLAVLEGMSHGLAVLAFASGGIPEQIADGKTGVLVPPGDVEAYAAELRRLMSNRMLVGRIGDAARIRASRELSWASTAASYERVYRHAMSDTNTVMRASAARV